MVWGEAFAENNDLTFGRFLFDTAASQMLYLSIVLEGIAGDALARLRGSLA